MYIGVIAKRYAKALLDYAVEQGAEQQVYDEVQQLISVYHATDELRAVLSDPLLPKEEKLTVLVDAAKQEGRKVSAVWQKFIALVLQHKRESLMLFIAYSYVTLYRQLKHISMVHLTTATTLSAATGERLKRMVAEHSKEASEVILEERVDPDIIGGFIFQLDDHRLDASVKHEFEMIKNHFIDKNARIV